MIAALTLPTLHFMGQERHRVSTSATVGIILRSTCSGHSIQLQGCIIRAIGGVHTTHWTTHTGHTILDTVYWRTDRSVPCAYVKGCTRNTTITNVLRSCETSAVFSLCFCSSVPRPTLQSILRKNGVCPQCVKTFITSSFWWPCTPLRTCS